MTIQRPTTFMTVASVALVVLVGMFSGNLASAAGTDLAQSASPPDDFPQPVEWKSNASVLAGTLEVKRAPTSLGGRPILTLTYNGAIPGPTWRVKPGDHIKIHLVNNITPSASANMTAFALAPDVHHSHAMPLDPEEAKAQLMQETGGGMMPMETPTALHTNIHTHGLQVSPQGNSDNVLVDIAPGEFFDYDIPIPADQPAGLYFYHPHRHMAATRQFWNGLGGAIIIEGGLDDVPEVKAAKDRLMVVSELILNEDGQVPEGTNVPTAGQVDFSPIPVTPVQIYFPINGVLQPTLTIRPGETQRWRIVNGGAHRSLKLALEHIRSHELVPLHQIAQDGINFPLSKERETLLLAPGNRVEILVQGGESGLYQLKSLAHDQGHPGGPRPEVLLATLVSTGPRVPHPTSFPLPLIPTQMPDISHDKIANTRTVEWSGEIMTAPIVFELDGQTFDAERVDQTITVGTTEEWTLVNKDVFQHPFHIHVNPFQVIKVNNEDFPEPAVWWDTFALPPRGSVTVRMRFRPDVTGKTVFHCHILPHEDLGMMQLINLVSPGGPVITPEGPFSTGEPIPPPGRPSSQPLPSRPYVFTHLYPPIARHMALDAAKVAMGHSIEVQLPSEPTDWTPSIDGDSVRPNGRTQVFTSIGQYEGESAIDAFKFKAAKPGCATLTLRGAPPPPSWLENPIAITLEAVEGKVRGQPGECVAP